MASNFRNNIKGTFSAVAVTANNNDSELSAHSIAIARACVITEMASVLENPQLPTPYQMVIIAAIADFGRNDEAGLVRSHALDHMARRLTPATPEPIAQSITRFLTERLTAETDVNIRQDAVSHLAQAAVSVLPATVVQDAVRALGNAAMNDSEHDVRAAATQGLGRIVLEKPQAADVLETTGIIADVARNDTNRYVRWGAAHLIKKILMSDVANKIPVSDLAQRLTATRPAQETADVPGLIISAIESSALEDSESKVARKRLAPSAHK